MGGAVTALRVGVVGAGQISGAYLSTLRRLSNVEGEAVCDLGAARARTPVPGAPAAGRRRTPRSRGRRPGPQPVDPGGTRRGRARPGRRGQAPLRRKTAR